MKFEEWWATLTPSEQKLIGRTNAKFVWMEACEACAKLIEKDDSMRWSGAAAAIRAREQA